jgi:iron complex transport system substrate-binding protein
VEKGRCDNQLIVLSAHRLVGIFISGIRFIATTVPLWLFYWSSQKSATKGSPLETIMKQMTLLFLLLLLISCSTTEPDVATAVPTVAATSAPTLEPTNEPVAVAPTTNLTDSCVTDYDETVDYFPEKAQAEYTDGFSIAYFSNYKVVTVAAPFSGAEQGVEYLLVQCGTPAPEGYDGATIIEVPIERMVAMSTTYLPALEAIGRLDAVVGVDTALYTSNEIIRAGVDAGEIAEIGSGAEVNVEAALDLEPDLVMAYASGFAEFDAYPKLEEVGLTVVLNADYIDASPLGRAEWVDFIALFFNEEAAATARFAEVAAAYLQLAALTAELDNRPTVFANTPFDGTWYMPGGASYLAQFFADAGADYLWADDPSTSSLFLDFETVFERASQADYWLNVGYAPTLTDLGAADDRYTEFAAYQTGNVFNNDARELPSGGNDYYESAVVNPHLMLADLIKIFHPELVPDHQFVYHRAVK